MIDSRQTDGWIPVDQLLSIIQSSDPILIYLDNTWQPGSIDFSLIKSGETVILNAPEFLEKLFNLRLQEALGGN